MTSNPNPFIEDENWQDMFEQLPSYNRLKNSTLKEFKNTRGSSKNTFNFLLLPSFFMQLNKLFHTFTVASVSLILLFLFTVSAITAQAAAPEQFKPSIIVSNLFAANKQPDKDPQTQLAPNSVLANKDSSISPDDDNFVVNVDMCDLAEKSPKK